MKFNPDDETDKELQKLERKIKSVYKQAEKELSEEWEKYIAGWDEVVDGKTIRHKGLLERYAEEYEAYQNGKYTKEQFEAWYFAQVGRGERWDALRQKMANRMVNANQTACSMINDTTPGIWSMNYNYEGYVIDDYTENPGVDWTIINENTVKNLMMQNKSILPLPEQVGVNVPKDQRWNEKKMTNALLQGILQGKSIDKIADSFQAVSGINRTSAIRNARTSVTSAQNSGKQSAYDKIYKERGIKYQKEWDAARDKRVRESHAMLDGVRVDYDERFPNGLMYPGDFSIVIPSEVYNCRCTMRRVIPGLTDDRKNDNDVEMYKRWLTSNVSEVALEDDRIKPYNGDMKKLAREYNEMLDDILDKKSKWSGIIHRADEKTMPREYGRKSWDCSIILRDDADEKTLLHELLHARSASYYGEKEFIKHKWIEEATVELMSQEIMKSNGMSFRKSYSDKVNALKRINSIAGGSMSHGEFAKTLLGMDYASRERYIENMVDDVMKTKRLHPRNKQKLKESVQKLCQNGKALNI